jgi:hypothetical protein
MAFNLVYLSQQDPQWKNDILGFGDPGDTIGYVGCALTSISMLLSGYGFSETPQSLNQKLQAKQGFSSASIRWDVVCQVHPEVTLRGNVNCETTDAPLGQIDSALAAGHPVVVRVDASPNPGLQWHYVLIYGRQGDDYLILDPWPYQPGTAKPDFLMKRYSQGRPLQRAIQQVLFYQVSGASGPVSIPAGTPQTQPAPVPTSTSGTYARVMDAVGAMGLNIRSSTDTSSLANLVINVPVGTQLLLLDANTASKIGQQGQWLHVREPGGKEGFCAAWYLEPVAATTPDPTTAPAPSPVSPSPSTSSAPAPVIPPPSTPSIPPVVTTTTPPTTTSTVPPVTSTTTNSTPTTSSTTTAPVPDTPKVQVIVKGNNTRIYASAFSTAIVSLEKAGARLTVLEPASTAQAKIGVKGQKINVKATNNKRGFIDGDAVRSA